MNNKLSRLLALLLSVVLLVSSAAAAFAEGVNEVGSIESIEEMVFERVKQLFPESDNERRYLFISYYESDSASKAEALMATLADDERIAFINWRAENDKCIDGCDGVSGCTVIDCACLCHKVAEFEENMRALIEQLKALDMDEVKPYLYSLRQWDLHLALYEKVVTALYPPSPDVTPGNSINDADYQVMKLASEDEEELTGAQALLSDFKNLQGNDNSEIGQKIGDTLTTYTELEDNYVTTYSNDEDTLDSNIAGMDLGASSALMALRSAVSGDIMLLAAEQSEDFRAIEADSDDLIVQVFNYTDEYLTSQNSYLKFSQGSHYGDAVDGTDAVGLTGGWVEMKKTLVNGYPTTEAGNSLSYLFSGTPLKGTMRGNTGLFQRTGTRHVYDSKNNAAWYNGTNFTLYSNPVCPAYSPTSVGNNYGDNITDTQAGNFLPFNQLIDGTTLKVAKYGTSSGGIDRYKLTDKVDMWFGLYINGNFYMPKNGKITENGSETDMVFEFLGDDDVWVYIDDVLVLDIGGTHGALTGTINFNTGAVKYSNSSQTNVSTDLKTIFTEALGSNSSVIAQKFDADKPTFKDYTDLDIKIYYLERGGNISYCRYDFNLPILPPGGMTVGKDVENVTDLTNTEYTFKLEVEDEGNSRQTVTGATYTIVNGDGTEYTTDEDGQFTIKHGQRVHFADLPSQKTYYVTELTHDYTESTIWHVGGEAKQTPTAEVYIEPNQEDTAFVQFINEVKDTSITVEKKIHNGRVSDPQKDFNYTAQILLENANKADVYKLTAGTYEDAENDTAYTVAADGTVTFTLKQDQKVKISDLPIGATVVVTETADNITEYTMTVQGNSLVTDSTTTGYIFTGVVLDEIEAAEGVEALDPQITITNTPNCYPLTIKKTNLDTTKDPNSNTMYHVVCQNTGIDMVVAINGNSSVTINDLPVGTYTVTELTDWSWRYDPKNEANEVEVTQAVVVDDNDNQVTFRNDRTYEYWLDGEAEAKENQFSVNKDTSDILIKEIYETDDSDEEYNFVG